MSIRIDGINDKGKRTNISIPDALYWAYIANRMLADDCDKDTAIAGAKSYVRSRIREGVMSHHIQTVLVSNLLDSKQFNLWSEIRGSL